MDLNDIRAALTVASFVAFLAVVFWAYDSRRKAAFDRVAQSVLEEDDDLPAGKN